MNNVTFKDTEIYFKIDKIVDIILTCFENNIRKLPFELNIENDETSRMLGMIAGMKYSVKYNSIEFDEFVAFINNYLLPKKF